MKRAFAESRPFLLLSLFFGISYYFLFVLNAPEVADPIKMLWKGAGVGFLAVFAMVRLHRRDGKMLGGIMALGAVGDILIELDLIWGAIAFALGHVLAIGFYARFRRHRLAFSQKLFAILLVPAVVFIAWAIPFNRADAAGFAFYSLLLSGMAAMAWTSRFSRYRVGLGAMMFVASDLLIFSRTGPLETSIIPDLLIWPLYYFGQFLIATGVVATLRHEMAAESADPV